MELSPGGVWVVLCRRFRGHHRHVDRKIFHSFGGRLVLFRQEEVKRRRISSWMGECAKWEIELDPHEMYSRDIYFILSPAASPTLTVS